MRYIFEKFIQRKNPSFRFHTGLSTATIASLFWQKISMKLRAQKLWLFLRNPRGLFLGKDVQFFNLKNLKWGNFVQLEDHVFLNALGIEPLILSDNVRIGAFSRLIISTTFDQPGKGIFIGKNVGIGEFSYLGGAGGLHIGEDCIIGQYFSTHPENHVFRDISLPIRLQGVTREGIFIGPNCWIGSKVTVLDGVHIGTGTVIAAGAVVTKSFPAGSVIGGVPAKVLSERNTILLKKTILASH
jgi:acetyltransferase-like isoleucine patch superfamily enzyme